MRETLSRLLLACDRAAAAVAAAATTRCSQQDEQVKAAWAEVVNQYQRRADLIPNLVNTVKGFARAGAARCCSA